jgi:hypothetical protein
MLDLIEKYIISQWQAVMKAGGAFVTAVLASAVIIWLVMNWGFGRIIDNKDAEVASLKAENERLRVAANISPATSSLISLNNSELKKKTAYIVDRLRAISSVVNTRTAEISAQSNVDDKAKHSQIESVLKEMDRQFVGEVRADAYNIDFELRRRLGPQIVAGIVGISPSIVANDGTRININQLLPSDTTPVFDLGFIPTLADGIEQMARLLPKEN